MKNDATELLKRLSPDQIRKRLSALTAEERALRTLLRAAVRMHAIKHDEKRGAR